MTLESSAWAVVSLGLRRAVGLDSNPTLLLTRLAGCPGGSDCTSLNFSALT